jgi:opacity protein-like surface antigen
MAAAPDRVGHIDWGISAAGAFNDGGTDDTAFYSTAISYGLTPYFAIGVEGGYQEADAAEDESVGTGGALADLILRIPNVHPDLVPYGVLGLGWLGSFVEDEDGVAPNNNGDDVDDSGFGWKIGGGFDWFFNPNWALNFEVAYYDASDVDLAPSSVTDSSWVTVGGGLKFVF